MCLALHVLLQIEKYAPIEETVPKVVIVVLATMFFIIGLQNNVRLGTRAEKSRPVTGVIRVKKIITAAGRELVPMMACFVSVTSSLIGTLGTDARRGCSYLLEPPFR